MWIRNDLVTRYKRLMRLERAAQDTTFTLSDKQVEQLERLSPEFRTRHVESSRPGQLLH